MSCRGLYTHVYIILRSCRYKVLWHQDQDQRLLSAEEKPPHKAAARRHYITTLHRYGLSCYGGVSCMWYGTQGEKGMVAKVNSSYTSAGRDQHVAKITRCWAGARLLLRVFSFMPSWLNTRTDLKVWNCSETGYVIPKGFLTSCHSKPKWDGE